MIAPATKIEWLLRIAVALREGYNLDQQEAEVQAATLFNEARRQSEESVVDIWTILDAKYQEIARGDYQP